jgi:Ca2+:H+ antiporter
MSPSQATTLLPPVENNTDRTLLAIVKGEGEPSWSQSYKWFFFSSYFNVLLVFVPLSALANYLHWDVSLRFSFSFLAIVPLAKVFLSHQQMIELY